MIRLVTLLVAVVGFALGVHFYCRGFLLNRRTLSNKSSCSDIQAQFTDDTDVSASNVGGCWINPALYHRAVILVIDALRYDFAAEQLNRVNPFYHNKLTEINRLLAERPLHSRLVQFTADPPTTTMQRLKGLTTGSLPTFIDAGSNFDGAAIDEDNVIAQLNTANRSVVFLGDDTWTSLFPNHFLRSHSFPSFDVKDLHTVDNGVLQHIYLELARKDWSVLIAHFLGVDHCGHKYGPSHPEMAKKLGQMNDVIRNVTKLLDEDTLLLVIGDHGMTESGDHGGDSANELNAAMFVYSPTQQLAPTVSDTDYSPATVAQVDLVPTLSLLLDLPIPFASLGSLIGDLFADAALRSHALRVNAWQVVRYADSYAKTSGDAGLRARLEPPLRIFHSLRPEELTDKRCTELIQEIQAIFRDTWAKFHDAWILLGLLSICETVLWVLRLLLVADGVDQRFVMKLLTTALAVVALSANNELIPPVLGIFLGCQVCWDTQSLVNALLKRVRSTTGGEGRTNSSTLLPHLWIIPYLIYCVSAFSNSFIVYENLVSHYVCVTLLALLLLNCMKRPPLDKQRIGVKAKPPKSWTLLIQKNWTLLKRILYCVVCIALLRIGAVYHRCREEQVDCKQYGLSVPFRSLYGSQSFQIFRFLLAVISLLFSTASLRRFLCNNGHFEGSSLLSTLLFLCPWIVTLCILFHWSALWVPETMAVEYNYALDIIPPMLVYLFTVVFTVLLFVNPHLVTFKDAQERRPPAMSNAILEDKTSLFRHFKANWSDYLNNGRQQQRGQNLSVYGLASVYSGALAALLSFWFPTFSMILGDGLMGAWLIIAFVLFLTLHVVATSSDDGMTDGTLTALLATLVGQGFFLTGHQPTFNTLPWEAAFVGLPGNFRFQAAPALLVLLHLFASAVLVGIVAPFAVVWPCYAEKSGAWAVVENAGVDRHRSEYDALADADRTEARVWRLTMRLIFVFALKLVAVVLSSCIHRRHLMVWKIFAPKFIFEGVSFFVVCLFLLISNLLIKRIHSTVPKELRDSASVLR